MNIGFDAKRLFHNNTGLGNYSRDLVRILAEFYPKNSYFLYNPKPKKINRIQLVELRVVEKLYNGIKLFSGYWRLKGIVKTLKKDKIDVYHGLSGEIPIGISKTKIKTVVTIHDLIFVRYPHLYSFFDRKIHLKKFLYACQNANQIVAISEQTKLDIVSFLKIDPKKIKVIYQGCHNIFKQQATTEQKQALLKKYNLPEKFLLNVGTIEKRKNIFSVIKAIQNTKIPLIVIGKKTAYFKEINTFLEKNQEKTQIYFLENIPLEELALFYQTATIFIYPSVFEGFGIPIIEALYSKTPVITSKGSCFAEAGGENSVYINPNNVFEIKEVIISLWNDFEKRQKMAEDGCFFVQKFDDKVIAKQWNDLYNAL